MIRSIITAALLSPLAIVGTASAATDAPPTPKFMTTPCAFEDSVNCYWDASKHGNGEGHSFFAIRYGKSGVLVRYWDRSYGRKHDKVLTDGW